MDVKTLGKLSVNDRVDLDGVSAVVRHVAPDRVVLSQGEDLRDPGVVVSFDRSDGVLLQTPSLSVDWTSRPELPLAGELRVGHKLPPAPHREKRDTKLPDDQLRKRRPRQLTERAESIPGQTTAFFQVVMRVYVVPDGRFGVRTVDTNSQYRTYRFEPLEQFTLERDRYRRPRVPALGFEPRYDGPFLNSRGAQFVFVLRSASGGRPPRNAYQFSDDLEPMYHPVTGDLMPYVVLAPARRTAPYVIRQPISAFSKSALETDPVQRAVARNTPVPDDTGEAP